MAYVFYCLQGSFYMFDRGFQFKYLQTAMLCWLHYLHLHKCIFFYENFILMFGDYNVIMIVRNKNRINIAKRKV